jgi:hypothetical protein
MDITLLVCDAVTVLDQDLLPILRKHITEGSLTLRGLVKFLEEDQRPFLANRYVASSTSAPQEKISKEKCYRIQEVENGDIRLEISGSTIGNWYEKGNFIVLTNEEAEKMEKG